MLSHTDKIFIGFLTVVFSVGLGTTLGINEIKRVARAPGALLIGLLCQFGWMPLLGSLAVGVLGLGPVAATGLLLMTCAPGGGASNMFAYFANADLALSVAMTTVSTLFAVIATPALLALYATHHGISVPIAAVAATLAGMLVPISAGMWLRWKRPPIAARLEQVGALAGLGVIALFFAQSAISPAEVFGAAGPRLVGACIALPLCGMVLGYVVAWLTKRSPSQRRSIALETGVQNTPLAMAVVITSFPKEAHDALLNVPIVYGFLAIVVGTVLTLVYRVFSRNQPAVTEA